MNKIKRISVDLEMNIPEGVSEAETDKIMKGVVDYIPITDQEIREADPDEFGIFMELIEAENSDDIIATIKYNIDYHG